MENGWIRLYRQILTSQSVRQLTPGQRWFWVGLLLIANPGLRRPGLRGCLCDDEGRPFSHRQIADHLGIAVGAVGRNLAVLERLGMIRRRQDGLIHVTNFAKYQAPASVHGVNGGVHQMNGSVHQMNSSVHQMNATRVHKMNAVQETRVHGMNSEAQEPMRDNGSGDSTSVHEMNSSGETRVHRVNAREVKKLRKGNPLGSVLYITSNQPTTQPNAITGTPEFFEKTENPTTPPTITHPTAQTVDLELMPLLHARFGGQPEWDTWRRRRWREVLTAAIDDPATPIDMAGLRRALQSSDLTPDQGDLNRPRAWLARILAARRRQGTSEDELLDRYHERLLGDSPDENRE